MVDTAKGLMEAGMGGVVYCGSMGDWVLLTDDQRQRGVEALVGADIPVVVGTGAFTPALACAHAAHAADVGASGLMVIPRVLSRGTSSAAQRTHFSDVLTAGSGLPSVIYNSPYYGFETKADLFFDLRAQHDNLVGYKEFGGRAALSYAAEHITSATEDLMLLVGVDTQVVHGIVDCGAVGVITGVGNVLPVAVLRLVELSREAAAGDPGSHRLALELERALATLSLFDEGPDLVLYYKHLAVLAGDNAYTESLHGSDTLSDSQKRYATDQFEQFDRWWSAWSGSASKPAVMVPPDFA
jgi:4-hydroxy-tetrahydrodipicolinate synthase